MNYTLHQLQVFLKVTETQSITKAAEALHLTQPAVSIQLKNFQDQFEIPLTEVIGRQLSITEFGQEIAQAAQRIVDEVQTISLKTNAFKGLFAGTLKLSVVSTGKYVMPFYLSDFLKMHPNVSLEMDVTNKSKVINSLQNNEVDFALVSTIPQNIDVQSEFLMKNKLVLVSNKNKSEMNVKKLLETSPLIYREDGSATKVAMEKYIEQQKIQSSSAIMLTSNEAVKQAVIAGMGISIMPVIGLKNELDNHSLSIIPAKGLPIDSQWCLVWLSGKKFSPVGQAFLQYIKENKDSILNEKFGWIDNY